MKKKIILVGKAASGKDYFRDFLNSKGFKNSISHTTRPKRDGEIDGKTYHFVNNNSFLTSINANHFFEYKKFNGWFYGTTKTEAEKSEVFILTPEGIKSLPYKFLKDCEIIYFDMPEDVRIKRLEKRSDSDSIERRLKADKEDFENFNQYTLKFQNPNFDCEAIFEKYLK